MPFGPFKDFADCVRVQQQKGSSLKTARAVCGEIEKRLRKSSEGTMIPKKMKEKKFDEDGREIVAENVPIIITSQVEVFDDE